MLAKGAGPAKRLTHAFAPAQIAPVFRAFVILVRTTYLMTALLVLVWSATVLVSMAWADPGDRYRAIALVALCLLPVRALERLLHHATFVPDSHIRERPVVASLVCITSLLGWALMLLAGWTMIRVLPQVDIGGPLAGTLMLALMLFAIALLVGELVLVGRLKAHQT